MNYAEMLDQLIAESQLSLRQISKRCADLDITITPSYISQLKNGKLPPPSVEVSLALAKACDSKDESKLIFQGYLEKAPDVIKNYIIAVSELNKKMLQHVCENYNNGALAEDLEQAVSQLDILTTLEFSSNYHKEMESASNLDSLIENITLKGGGIINDSNNKNMICFFIGDTAMAPTIPVHSYIYTLPTKIDLLKERDIIAFNPLGRKKPTLRRTFFVNDKILLIPEDKSQQIYMIENFEELDYVGKVVSYKVDC